MVCPYWKSVNGLELVGGCRANGEPGKDNLRGWTCPKRNAEHMYLLCPDYKENERQKGFT